MPETGANDLSPVKRALVEIRELRARLQSAEQSSREPIAIIGMAVRLPGGITNPAEFWQLLIEGRDAVTEVPAARWNASEFLDADPGKRGKMYSARGAFLDGVDEFDSDFFGVTPREAEAMDPQQRLLLELAWEALENAAIPPRTLAGASAGIFLGISNSDHARTLLADARRIDAHSSMGSALSIAAGRLSYFFDCHGPSIVVDTACSSSLTAVHLACQSLRLGESSVALVGGSNLMLLPELHVAFAKTRMLAPDGRCKTFDASAGGYVRGEGCAVLVLKRLSDAQQAGDRIVAVIRGSAVNQDGRSAGITAPNGPAQERVIRAALENAAVRPSEVDYVEAHGTGTPLGDPIEAGALAAVYGEGREQNRPLQIGSVKTNLGHLEAAAGLAGLIKVVLMFEHGTIPAHLHLTQRNPHLDWTALPLAIPTLPVAWARGERPRLAAVSSFGFSGSNAHVVLAEPPPQTTIRDQQCEEQIFCISARSDTGLRELARRYESSWPAGDFEDICFTAATGRAHHPYRLAIRARTAEQAREQLSSWLRGESGHRIAAGTADAQSPRVAFVFTPDAAVDQDELARIADRFPVFREASARHRGTRTPVTLQSALAALWQSWGIQPALVTGAASGEITAACVAGVFSPESAQALLNGNAAISLSPPNVPFLSSLTGRIEQQFVATPVYWRRHAQEKTDLQSVRQAIQHVGSYVQLEVGSCSLASIFTALQQLYTQGVAIEWTAFYRDQKHRKVVLPTYPFERKRYPLGAAHTVEYDARWTHAIASAERQSEAGPLGWDVSAYPAKWACLNRWADARIRRVLSDWGVFQRAGESHVLDELADRCNVAQGQRRLLKRWLRGLAGDWLAEDGGRYVCRHPLDSSDLESHWQEATRLFTDDPAALTYLERCGQKLPAVMTGKESPLETLFPGGSFEVAEALYERSLEARYLNPIVAAAVESAAREIARKRDTKILEAGAGTGGTTAALLSVLPPECTEYWMTDVSEQFLSRGRHKFARYPFVRYARLDLEHPLSNQGFGAGTFDIIIAANVVHAVRNIEDALTSLRSLLAPGGLLVLLESTTHFRWFDVSTGLIEGWQQFADDERHEHPLLPADRWVELLKQCGLAKAERLPRAGSLADTVGQHVILAQSANTLTPASIVTAAASPVEMASNAPQKLVANWQALPIHEQRSRITEYVRGCVRHVFNLTTDGGPALRDRLTDLGMDSLMALELRTVLERGLGWEGRLSSTVALSTGTIEELANQILRVESGAEPVEPSPHAVPVLSAEEIGALSDEDVAALLKERIGSQ